METVALWIGVLGIAFALAVIHGFRHPQRWRFLWTPAALKVYLRTVAAITGTALLLEVVFGVVTVALAAGTVAVGLTFALQAIWLGTRVG